MKPPKYCFKCGQEVQVNCHYFKFVEYNKNRKIDTRYAHKLCWDEIKSTLNITSTAQHMLDSLKDKLIEEGIMKPREIELEIK